MDYTIGMTFIGWMIAIWMLMGFGVIKGCELDVRTDDGKDKDASNMIIDKYNSSNLGGRIAFVMWIGARLMAVPFKIKGADD